MIARLLNRIHLKMGDFWWYSLMMFCAFRVADVLNVFVGLWLVPKYIDPSELGAVLPLASFAEFLALPASIFAVTFTKELNTLATRGEFGKMKTLMRSVFLAVGGFMVLAIVVCALTMPFFLDKIRIVKGSLGILVIASAFVGCVAPIYANALQALKKFKAISIMTLICSPVRLVSMLIAMPFRPLSGYFVGQASTPSVNILASVWLLRKELAVRAESYWSRPVVRRFALLFLGMAGYQLSAKILGLTEQTLVRHNLPDVESAAYYMVTRFSEITVMFSTTLLTVLFPFTAEAAETGRPTRPLVVKASVAIVLGGGALAVFFALFGRPILEFLPHGDSYAPYSWAIPWLIGINVITAIQTIHTQTEVSAARFSFLKWWLPLNLGLPPVLMALPIHSLRAMLTYFTLASLAKAGFAINEIRHSK